MKPNQKPPAFPKKPPAPKQRRRGASAKEMGDEKLTENIATAPIKKGSAE